MLLDCDGAVVVANGSELTQFVRNCLERPDWATEMGSRAQQLTLSQQGAVERTMGLLRDLIGTSVSVQRQQAA
jgi:hypothetical protein